MRRLLLFGALLMALSGGFIITGCDTSDGQGAGEAAPSSGVMYTVDTMVDPATGGSIRLSPGGGSYSEGTALNVTAIPAQGYVFDHWGGDASGTNASSSLTVDGNKTITAYFRQAAQATKYNLSVSVDPGGSGAVNPAGGTYNDGTEVSVTATPSEGFEFDHWSGDVSETSSSISLTMDNDKNIVAHFKTAMAQGVLFEDNFDDNRNGWYQDATTYLEGGVFHVVLEHPDPEVAIKRILYRWPDTSRGVSDFCYEADVTTVECDAQYGRGIIFLCDPAKPDQTKRPRRCYIFMVSGKGTYLLAREIEGKSTTIVPWTKVSSLKVGDVTNRLKVVCHDSIIELYINDELVREVKGEFPSEIGDGGIGLFLYGADGSHVTFDNMKMWVP